MKAKIKKAQVTDIQILNNISIASKMHWNYPKEWLEKWTPDLILTEKDFLDQDIYKLEEAGSTIGFCSIKENNTNYEIMHLWIKPGYIGKGYGKQLLNEIIQKVVKKEKKIIVESDPNAEAFYASQGFVTFDKVESYPKGRFLPIMKKYYPQK